MKMIIIEQKIFIKLLRGSSVSDGRESSRMTPGGADKITQESVYLSATEKAEGEACSPNQRLVLKSFLTPEECKELEFIHKSCSTVGYRANVFSLTLSHLAATNSHHLIMPFVPIRERLKEKAEEFFGCDYQLFVEFTGLISWSKGASIGWHSDDNRPYLKQRHFTAVCYLNSHGIDFEGGLLRFQEGEPRAVTPLCGDVVMYTADSRNIHSVDEITDGERLTLSLWFSLDGGHDEDAKLVSILSKSGFVDNFSDPCLPLPASSNMYWFSSNQPSDLELGFDVCWARLDVLGYSIYASQETGFESDSSELLMKPLRIATRDELFDVEFVNILHALQVVQFQSWKASELHNYGTEENAYKVLRLSRQQREEIIFLRTKLCKDLAMPRAVLGWRTQRQDGIDWGKLDAAVLAWKEYTWKLHSEFLRSLPHWRAHQSIFDVS